ncbi:MAG: 16S rRNA (cytidine(1402)-2'-O)-methyltransferase [Myxococcales bacterium]|nr:16S rRNA (cytidine(1402)-2'-O)-methyltransferase [Myxococcales bacterium]MCB9545100.1 16S rRNA (cytidine(1402)-2'-O)-methyltransferase [Myxococcales bacterium]
MGTLHLVAVPIGNLEDITLRALRLLKTAERIACEDTRRTGKLLELLGIERPRLVALHEHNEEERLPGLIAALEAGESLVLVSDAGTPAISDPGFRLVRAAVAAGVPVVPVPGPCAAIAALCASGLPTDAFRFVGFLPPKSGQRKSRLLELAAATETLIFYASPHRIEEVLADAAATLGGDRQAVIAREITKHFEEFRRGTLAELVADPGVTRGEIVLLIGGATEAPADEDALRPIVESLLREGYSPSLAAKEAARRTGARRGEAYRLAVELAQEEP